MNTTQVINLLKRGAARTKVPGGRDALYSAIEMINKFEQIELNRFARENPSEKRRWVIRQMGVPTVHPNIKTLIEEIEQLNKYGMNGDKFELEIKDMEKEQYENLPEFQGN